MIDVKAQTTAYEEALRQRGIRLQDVLARAGVDRSTWTRWKGGQSPTMAKWGAVQGEMERTIGSSRHSCGGNGAQP